MNLFKPILLTVIIALSANCKAQDGKIIYLQVAQNVVKQQIHYQAEVSPLDSAYQFKELVLNYSIRSIKPLSKLKLPEFERLYEIKCLNTESAAGLISKLKTLPWIVFAENAPDYHFLYNPNDYTKSKQYNLSVIKADLAWDISKGNKNIVLAIVDDAVDTTHPDLKARIWRNKSEIKGNGQDDDGNGYIDDWYGWDAADNDNNPNPPSGANSGYFSHGTHCSGIATASTDNNTGIASISFNITLMPVKIAASADETLIGAYGGVEYAITNNANIISMSWGGAGASKAYQMLFDLAYSRNIICVAAAGNDGINIIRYPAAYNHVISVGSTTSADIVSNFSNFGTWVDVFAPGSSIYSTVPGTTAYDYKSGTSMACPLVSGLCGLMLSFYPGATVDEIESCLKSGCDDINNLNPSKIGLLGAGRINALRSLQCLKVLNAEIWSDQQAICIGNKIQFRDTSRGKPISWSWKFPGGTPSTSTAKNPLITYNTNGTYDVELTVNDGINSETLLLKNYIKVYLPSVQFSDNKQVSPGAVSYFTATFTGIPPFELIYTDGLKNDTIRDIYQNILDIVKTVNMDVKYWPLKVKDKNCNGTVKDTAYLKVINGNDCKLENKISVYVGSRNNDYIAGIYEIDPNNIVIAGHTDSVSNYEIFVQVLNNNGRIISGKIYNYSGDQKINKFLKVIDGYLLIGSSTGGGSGSEDVFVMKINNNYSPIWAKVIGGSSSDVGYKILESVNKKYYYVSAGTSSYGQGNADTYIIKMDSSGNFLWNKVLGNNGYGIANEIIELESGNIIVSSGTYYPSINKPFYVKLSPNGNLIWIKEDANSLQSDCQALIYFDGSVFGTIRYKGSNTEKDALVFKADTNLNVIWAKLASTPTQDVPNVLCVLDDSSIIVGGFTYVSSTFGGIDNWVIRYTKNGTHIKNSFFGGNLDDIPVFVSKHTKNRLFISGYSNSNSIGNVDGYFRQLNCALTDCTVKTNIFSVSNFTLSFGNISHTVTAGGIVKSLTLTSKNFKLRTKYLCADTTLINAPVNAKCRLAADFTWLPVCTGQDMSFTDASVDTSGKTLRSWKWYFDADSVFGGPTVKYTFNTNGYHTVKLMVYSGDTVLCMADTTKLIWVTDSFKVLMPPDITICEGDSAVLGIASTKCGSLPYTYSWSPANGLNNTNIANPKASPASSTLYTVTVTDKNGMSHSASITVNINMACCKSFAGFRPHKREVCIGDSFVINNTSKAKPAATYAWQFMPDGLPLSSNLTNPGIVRFLSIGNKTVQLIVTDACGKDTFIDNLGVNPLPLVYAGKDTAICFTETLQLGDAGLSDLKYLWTPATYLSSTKISNPTAIPKSAITYVIKATDKYTGCSNMDTVDIIKAKGPKLEPMNDTFKCADSPIWLSYTKEPNISYKWHDNSSATPYLFKLAGLYSLNASNGCGDTTVYFMVRDTSCNCSVYIPNAFSPNDDAINDVFRISSVCSLSYYELSVFNRWGEIIFKGVNINQGWDGTYKGEIVQDGLYYYIVSYRKDVLNLTVWEYGSGYIELIR